MNVRDARADVLELAALARLGLFLGGQTVLRGFILPHATRRGVVASTGALARTPDLESPAAGDPSGRAKHGPPFGSQALSLPNPAAPVKQSKRRSGPLMRRLRCPAHRRRGTPGRSCRPRRSRRPAATSGQRLERFLGFPNVGDVQAAVLTEAHVGEAAGHPEGAGLAETRHDLLVLEPSSSTSACTGRRSSGMPRFAAPLGQTASLVAGQVPAGGPRPFALSSNRSVYCVMLVNAYVSRICTGCIPIIGPEPVPVHTVLAPIWVVDS